MIFDTIDNALLYANLGPRFARGLEYLKNTDLTHVPVGKYEIGGPDVLALVQEYETRPIEKALWESHRLHADLQFVVAGVERMGYAPLSRMTVTREFIEKDDAQFLTGTGDFINVQAGMFTVFLPQDVHMPTLFVDKPAPVKKVVVKVRLV